jgi:hypothetical protein
MLHALPSRHRQWTRPPTRPVASDSVVLPLSIACERSGLSETELVAHWHVQLFVRRFMNEEREEDVAVVVPRSLVAEPDVAEVRRKQEELDALQDR